MVIVTAGVPVSGWLTVRSRCVCGGKLIQKLDGERLTPVYLCARCDTWLDVEGHPLELDGRCPDCDEANGRDGNGRCPECLVAEAEYAAEVVS